MREDLKADIEAASGRISADSILRNGRYLDVFTGEVVPGDMAIRNGRIVGIGKPGSYHGSEDADLGGRIVVPGLIDAHVHIESSLHGPVGFAGLTVPKGTTTIIADPHEIANVCGMDGIKWLLAASENVPQSVFVMLPSCVPAMQGEDSGAVLEASDLAELIDHPRVLGLGEVMDYPAVAAAEKGIVEKIVMARRSGKKLDGHSPGMTGTDLAAYAVSGIGTDHECSTLEEMRERLRLGMRVLIREGTAARDLAALVKGVEAGLARRCAFCTDDKLGGDILEEGHIDFNIRKSIGLGLSPIEAVRLATLNAAEAYGLDDRGALVPGRRADLTVLEGELEDFRVGSVYHEGVLVADGGRLVEAPSSSDNTAVLNTVRPAPLNSRDFDLVVTSGRARVITMESGSLVTGEELIDVPIDADGRFLSDGSDDLLKLVVVERHKGSGRVGLGIVKGYGLRGGAVASSIAHDSHNLIAIGDDDEAIFAVLQALVSEGGGISMAAAGGELLGTLPLPLGGLMTDSDGEKTAVRLKELIAVAHNQLSVRADMDPFMSVSFLALPVIPKLKLTTKGLFDVSLFEFVSVEV